MALVGPYRQLSVAGVEGEGVRQEEAELGPGGQYAMNTGYLHEWFPDLHGSNDTSSIKHTVSSHLEEASSLLYLLFCTDMLIVRELASYLFLCSRLTLPAEHKLIKGKV